MHELVDILAKSRLNIQSIREGREGSGQELANITGQIRRTLSTSILKANANCLLARVGLVGEGAESAGKRRRWASQEEEKMRREREAWWLATKMGKNIVRRGHFFMN